MDVSRLGQNDFLTLLIAQLKNQDPLNPASNTEFIAQLAQFSTLEQMTLMNANLEKSLESSVNMTEAVSNAMIINYFGKYVTAETDSFMYEGKSPVELRFDLDSVASWGKLQIIDESGNIIRSVSLDVMEDGVNFFEWDGMTNMGVQAKSGIYKYTVELYDVLGNEVEVSQMFSGVVDGISFKNGVPQLNIGGVLVPFDRVKDITQ
jgi:flagellar basal-body rod modification protein FlgD